MQFWDNIINAALIGTDKRMVSAEELPAGLAEPLTIIKGTDTTDKEQKFLQLASIALNYRQSGIVPLKKETPPALAAQEEKKYCNSAAAQILKDILDEESLPLLKLWLEKCNGNQQIVDPAAVPALLDIAAQQKSLQTIVAACCGKRGEWLSHFNDDWKFSLAQSAEEIWQTGTLQQRKDILLEIRKADSNKARIWLEQIWSQEDANTKLELLAIVMHGISEGDIPFLENVATEKSKKLKEAAQKLLKLIPGSAIIQQYQEMIRQTVTITKKKAMLGLSSKNVLEFNLPESIPEAIFKSGIEKLAGIGAQKNSTDNEFILYQLSSFIPPPFWETHLNASPAEVIELFKATTEGEKLIPAIGMAAGRFRTVDWATLFTNDPGHFYMDLVSLLPKPAREKYLLQQIKQVEAAESVISLAVQEETEWSHDLALAIVKHTSKNPYNYNRSFYNQHIRLLPETMINDLEQLAPTEEHLQTMWMNISEYIKKIMELKMQTEKAFNLNK